MISDDFTESAEFSCSFVLFAELEGPMCGHLQIETEV